MRLRNVRRSVRAAYTLIEMMVVMAIIAVLVGLLLSAVMSVLAMQERTGNKADVSKLESSFNSALSTKYNGAKHLPSQLVLYNSLDNYLNIASLPANQQQGARISADALRKMFGPNFLRKGGTVVSGNRIVPWDGTTSATGMVVLEGHQCLVFYLGGYPVTSGNLVKMTGFSSDIANPWQQPKNQTPPEERIGPFYNFEATRLTNTFGTSGYYCYLDRYQTPFAYFGGTGSSNTQFAYNPSLGALCPNNAAGPQPYQDSTGKFAKPDSFQIISAGKDRLFGQGGTTWSPTNGSSDLYARDDIGNFSTTYLSNPVN